MALINYDDGVGFGDALGTAAIAGLAALAGRGAYKNIPVVAQDTLYDYFRGGGREIRKALQDVDRKDWLLPTHASSRVKNYAKFLGDLGEDRFVGIPAAGRVAQRTKSKAVGARGGNYEPYYINIGTPDAPEYIQATSDDTFAAIEAGIEPGSLGKDGKPFDIYIDLDTNKPFYSDNKRPTTPSRKEKGGRVIPVGPAYSAALNRLSRAKNYLEGAKPEDAKKLATKSKILQKGGEAGGVTTTVDLTNPEVVNRTIEKTLNDMSRNYTNIMRAEGFDVYDSTDGNALKKQFNYLKEFKSRANYRKKVSKDLSRLIPLIKDSYPNLSEEKIGENLAKAFAYGTANSNGEGSMRRLEMAIYRAINKMPRESEISFTGGGRDISETENSLINRMVELVTTGTSMGKGSLFPEEASGLPVTAKSNELARALAGYRNAVVADSADLLALMGLSGRNTSGVTDTLFKTLGEGNPGEKNLYEMLVLPALEQALTTGQFGRVRRILGGNRELFDYQGGFQDRARDYGTDSNLTPAMLEMIRSVTEVPTWGL
jgi:hypothetical protein